MAKAGRELVLLDSSVLINFLVIDRLDLLVNHPRYRFVITGHVRAEILDGNHAENCGLQFVAKTLKSPSLTIWMNSRRSANSHVGRFSAGKCAVIAAAKHRGLLVGLDDKVAKRTAEKLLGAANILDTVKIVGSLIEAGVIAVRDADKFIGTWSRNSFTPSIRTFAEFAPDNPPKSGRN